ncbi:hypothetical protein BC332_18954 [Capsicum chinense]|nr:hypothetical protein BC332_18954 [Capsicum chinense]
MQLAYLNLRDVANLVEISDTVRKLWGLQILVLREGKELKILPTSITTLPRLAILDVGGCPTLSCLPQGLSGVSNLKEMYGFKKPSSATTKVCCLSEVLALNQLRILQLEITKESMVDGRELAALKQLQLLRVIPINRGDSENNSAIRKLDNLSPPTCIEELYLKHFLGETTPSWINPISLPQLQYLCIEDSRLGETWETFQTAMPALKYLDVSHCNSLKNFPCNGVNLLLGFKTPKFEKYDRHDDPMAHLRRYCNQLRGAGGKEELLMAYFGKSIFGLASKWFVDHDIDT